MKQNLVIISAFFAAMALIAPAHAAMVTLLPGVVNYSIGEAPVVGTNIDFNTLPADENVHYATYTLPGVGAINLTNAAIVEGTTSGPFGHTTPTGLSATDHYLSVFGSHVESGFLPGTAVFFDLNSGITTVGFTWGSPETFNAFGILDNNNNLYTVTGSDILSLAVTDGNDPYFSFTSLAGIKRIFMTSFGDSFEIANMSVSSIPLPAALPLLGFGLVGLYAASRKKKTAAA